MELSVGKIDIQACEDRGQSPADIIQRGHPNEVWYVPFRPLDFKTTPDWRFYRREQHVVVPLFAYRTSSDPVDAIGFAFQLGVRAIHDLGGRPVRRLHLAVGTPAHQLFDELTGTVCWSFFLGFGVVLE